MIFFECLFSENEFFNVGTDVSFHIVSALGQYEDYGEGLGPV